MGRAHRCIPAHSLGLAWRGLVDKAEPPSTWDFPSSFPGPLHPHLRGRLVMPTRNRLRGQAVAPGHSLGGHEEPAQPQTGRFKGSRQVQREAAAPGQDRWLWPPKPGSSVRFTQGPGDGGKCLWSDALTGRCALKPARALLRDQQGLEKQDLGGCGPGPGPALLVPGRVVLLLQLVEVDGDLVP